MMASFYSTIFCIFLITVHLSEVKSESTANPSIPKYLLECYLDDGIYHRDNRLPSTFDSFLDLVRKVEQSQTSRNMNARELSLVLLHYLKQDGIQSLQPYNKFLNSHILPSAPSGPEYFKHRLTLIGLIPRIDQNYLAAVNETLSIKEMCNLHFMLSYSIDPYKRENEKCDLFYEEGLRPQHDPYDTMNNGYYRGHRYTRAVHYPHKSNRVDLEEKGEDIYNKSLRKKEVEKLQKILKKRTLENLREGSKPMTKREIREHAKELEEVQRMLRRSRRHSEEPKNQKAEVEMLPSHYPTIHNATADKSKFTIGNNDLLGTSEIHQRQGLQFLVRENNYGRNGGRYIGKNGHTMEENAFEGVLPDMPLSDCPVVNGIIKTSEGSLAIGNVIAGIAAGMNPEDIPPTRLNVDPKELQSSSDRINNIWGTTLAGTVADTLTSSAVLEIDSLQILSGGWNDTNNPKWYLLKNKDFKHMTEVALRGSLDGLILGSIVKEWTNKFNILKLSQILEIYYGCSWCSVGAKYRTQLIPKFAPDKIFIKQVYLMSEVLKKQKQNVLTVFNYSKFSGKAVAKVVQHIQNMGGNEKSHIGSFLESKVDITVNMIAVIDSSWGYESLISIFNVLRNADVASSANSNLTVLCGQNGRTLFTVRNIVDLYSKFTKYTLYENCTRGLNYPVFFETLDILHRQMYNEEKTSNQMNTASKVVVIFAYDSLVEDDINYTVEKSRNFRHDFPDVRLMVVSPGRTDPFLPLVQNPTDVYSIVPSFLNSQSNSVESFADGVKKSFLRISRPSCGSYFNDDSQGLEVRVIRDVSPGMISYYRVLPQYFYTVSGQAIITVRSKQNMQLRVCHSREMEYPVGPSPRDEPNPDFDPNRNPNYNPRYPEEINPMGRQTEEGGSVQCKYITTETYKIELNNPCEGISLQECRPLYISLYAPVQDNVFYSCPTCRLPINSQYEITASGLTCYNNASAILFSPFILVLLLILSLKNI